MGHETLAVFDYSNHKLCDLYDSELSLKGQAYDIQHKKDLSGSKSIAFKLPYVVEDEANFRWNFIKNEYLLRHKNGTKIDWYIINDPKDSKSSNAISSDVSCGHISELLRTRNIYLELNDENGIGTIDEIADIILTGTGWTLGEVDTFLENDGSTEKIRTLKSDGKDGALQLITSLCNLFCAYPVYHGDTKKVDLLNLNNRDKVWSAQVGKNLTALSCDKNSEDIITRLYVEGEYGDNGYVGIDDVNPTGLSYLLDFSYYKEIGVFTATHETALETYLTDVSAIKRRIVATTADILEYENILNQMIGQCKLVVYYKSGSSLSLKYVYGDVTDEQKQLAVGDKVAVLNSDGTHRYETIETTAYDLLGDGDYGVAKFVTPASGTIGAKEVGAEAKQLAIDELQKKIDALQPGDPKIEEYEYEIDQLESQLEEIYTADGGLYALMSSVMKADGYLSNLDDAKDDYAEELVEQDQIEVTFITAMGWMLKDGCWSNTNYVPGQEQCLYNDALDMMAQMCRPKVKYTFSLVPFAEECGIPVDKVDVNNIVKIYDEELRVNDSMYIKSVTRYIDQPDKGSIDLTNEDITLTGNDFGSLLSRMTQLADLIDQKGSVYGRAKAITSDGSIFVSRLEGQIDVLKNKILSSVSNWYTDDNGNIMFISADNTSAMMLSGSGFMLADSKTEEGEWRWRTFGTGHGITADEIVAGFLSADRIEAGSIATSKLVPTFGDDIDISRNASITLLQDEIESIVFDKGSRVFIQLSDPLAVYSASRIYYAGDICIYNSLQYKALVDISTPEAWNADHWEETGAVQKGDYWVNANSRMKVWQDAKSKTWLHVKQSKWGQIFGIVRTYCWSGSEWVEISNSDIITEQQTKITQTAESVRIEADRAYGAERELSAAITTTADNIRAEVSDNYYGKQGLIAISSDGIHMKASAGAQQSSIDITPTLVDMKTGTLKVDATKLIVNSQNQSIAQKATATTYSEYYASTSPTTPTGGSWSTLMPERTSSNYIFERVVVENMLGEKTYKPSANGNCISIGIDGQDGPAGPAGPGGKGISSMQEQYAISASNTTAPTTGWQNSPPAYSSSKPYYWTRTNISWTDGTSSTIGPVLDNGTNTAIAQAYSASDKADGIIRGDYTLEWDGTNGVSVGDAGVTLGAQKKLVVAANGEIDIASTGTNNAIVMKNGGIAVSSAGSITLKSSGSANAVTMNQSGIDISSAGAITVKNAGGNNAVVLDKNGISINSGGKIDIKSGSQFTVDSTNFKIDSSGNVELTGTLKAINGMYKLGTNNIIISETMPADPPSGTGATSTIWIQPVKSYNVKYRANYSSMSSLVINNADLACNLYSGSPGMLKSGNKVTYRVHIYVDVPGQSTTASQQKITCTLWNSSKTHSKVIGTHTIASGTSVQSLRRDGIEFSISFTTDLDTDWLADQNKVYADFSLQSGSTSYLFYTTGDPIEVSCASEGSSISNKWTACNVYSFNQ